MIGNHKIIAPAIYKYDNVIDFSSNLIEVSKNDLKKWKINNENATDWTFGKKILSYDEYPVNFNFKVDFNFIELGKQIFDCVSDYCSKNLTEIKEYESSIIRKYSTEPGFFEIESSDLDNPYRKVTAVMFLNSIDDGGELFFNNFDVKITPEEGCLVVFPSSFAYSFKINRSKAKENFIFICNFI